MSYAVSTPFAIINWDELFPRVVFHRGRTDSDGGHLDWINAMGWGYFKYHYHHGMGPHLHPDGKCPYDGRQTIIINPYNDNQINLGTPYIFQGHEYYSLNLVSRALTAHESMGVELALNNTGGIFFACSTGDSTYSNLGEEFNFTYPKILGIVTADNTFFETSNGKLRLLCHTKRAAIDDIQCFAYVDLDTIKAYMTKDGYFTDFDDSGTGVWKFTVKEEPIIPIPSLKIITPNNRDALKTSQTLTVSAEVINATYAKLKIGSYYEPKVNLTDYEIITFADYQLTESDIGDLIISVEIGNDIYAKAVSSTVVVRVEAIEKYITIGEGDWLKLYSNTSSMEEGRIVNIPADAIPYKWAMLEGLTKLNAYAPEGLTVIIGDQGEMLDECGRYWVAVGPKVMNPDHENDKKVTPEEMKYGTKIDVIIKDRDGVLYYIYAVVGDVKNHTYPNGIYQTGYAFPNGTDPYPDNTDGSIIEFMGKASIKGFYEYEIQKIVVYDN